MKTFSQYLEEANSKYIVSKNPNDKKWYVMGHVGNNKWMPVSNGFKNKAQAQKWAKSQDKVDIAARGEISDALEEKCWAGYKQVGMKKKGNKMVPNCVPVDEVAQDKDIKDKEGTQPAKYYAGDMAKSTKDKRAAHFAKKKSGPAPGDASAKTKPSVHTKKYKQMFGEDSVKKVTDGEFAGRYMVKYIWNRRKETGIFDTKADAIKHAQLIRKTKGAKLDEEIEGLKNKAEKSGMPYGILKKVYDRGMAAYKTGHRPGTTAQQWAFARVNSFVTKSKGTWGGADKDLAAKVRG